MLPQYIGVRGDMSDKLTNTNDGLRMGFQNSIP